MSGIVGGDNDTDSLSVEARWICLFPVMTVDGDGRVGIASSVTVSHCSSTFCIVSLCLP